MGKYHIPVEWTVSAVTVIEADTLKDAISLAHIRPLPKEYSYVSGSFRTNEKEAEKITEIMSRINTPINKKYYAQGEQI